MNNNYQLAWRLQTTGWNPAFDVNAINDFGMTPAEVALQAGNLDEFVEITSHPAFQPATMTRVGLFLSICRQDSEEHYKAIRKYLDSNFKFDSSVSHFVRLS